MESHRAQIAAHYVGSQCRTSVLGETASASVVGQDQLPVVSLMVRIARMEHAFEQFVGVPVPQIKEDDVEMTAEQIGSAAVDPRSTRRPSTPRVRRRSIPTRFPLRLLRYNDRPFDRRSSRRPTRRPSTSRFRIFTSTRLSL